MSWIRRSARIGTLGPVVAAAWLSAVLVAAPGEAAVAPDEAAADPWFDVETLTFAQSDPVPGRGGVAGLELDSAAPIAFDPDDEVALLQLGLGGGASTAELRVRHAEGWGEWMVLELDDHEGADPVGTDSSRALRSGAVATDEAVLPPVWIGRGAHEVELRTSAPKVTIELLTPEPDDASTAAPTIADPVPEGTAALVAGQPTIQPRSQWTTRANACDSGPNAASDLRAAVIHHTASANGYAQADVPTILRATWRYHVETRGWCDLGYNFVVDRFGTIWEGRAGGVDRPIIGAHAAGFNTWTFGAAYLGSFGSTSPPTAARVAMENLVAWKLALHGVDPLGTTMLYNRSGGSGRHASYEWIETPTVVGHGQLGLTSCPGAGVAGLLGGVRTSLSSGRVGLPPYEFPAHEPYEHGPGFVLLDRHGGLRPAGTATQPGGQAVAPAVAIAVDGGPAGGFTLQDDGSLRSYGATGASARAGFGRPVDLSVRSNTDGGWVLDTDGGLTAFGAAPARSTSGVGSGGAIAVDLDDDGRGYVLSRSGLHPVGGAPAVAASLSRPVDVAVRPVGSGGWVLESGGALVAFGGAPAARTSGTVGTPVAVLASPNGRGGWVADSEGRLVPFGEERPIFPISTTVGRGDTVDAALTTFVADESSDQIRYLRSLTALFLGSPATALDADLLAAKVTYEGRKSVVEDLAHSDAWAGAVVDDMYRDVLGRSADADGRSFWVGQLRNGLRTQDLGSHFYSSPEYVRAAGSHEAYVTRLYDVLLGRRPDAAGLRHWVRQLDAGAPAWHITAGFYQSIESRRSRVQALYGRILGRRSDPGGLEFWADSLLRQDDIALAIDLASSAEYYKRVTT